MLPSFIQQHQRTAAAVAAVVIALSLAVAWMQQRKPRSLDIKAVWCYDTESGKLFPGPLDQLPPVDAPSGAGRGVRAYVFSCGKCVEGEQFILHLETFNDAAREAFARPKNTPEEEEAAAREIERGRSVAAVPDAGGKLLWIPALDPRAASLTRLDRDRCKDGTPVNCSP